MKSIQHVLSSTPLGLLARTIVCLALTALQGHAQSIYEPYTFTTIAGKAKAPGSVDGTSSDARFNQPQTLALDTNGNLYVADRLNHAIRKMTPVGPDWVVTTIAGKLGSPGSVDGTNSAAQFNGPNGLAMDANRNLYVTELNNNTIRKMTPDGTNWGVTTLAGEAGSAGGADGTNNAARFNWPVSVEVDSNGNLYVADFLNHTIRKVTPVGTNWVVTTLAGKAGNPGGADGTNSVARFNGPGGVAVDPQGNLYVADEINCAIRKLTPVETNWVVTTIAGKVGSTGSADGMGSAARFTGSVKVAIDSVGNLYVAESAGNTIRKLTRVGTDWVVTTLAGKPRSVGSADGTGSVARFSWPEGMAVDSAGNLYLAEWENHTIRKGYPALVIAAAGFNDGQFGFDLTGQTGNVVVVEGSTDLVNWLPLWTNTLAGSLNFSDPQSSVFPTRFYRAQAK